MSNIVVVGAQWGDEGKGKIIDYLARNVDYVVRFQGGDNAGHTVCVGDCEFVLHLVPSGILHKGKVCVIGNGVVVNPKALIDEIENLKRRGVEVGNNLLISDQAHIILPYHISSDHAREARDPATGWVSRIGTTGRGIGPCYADKFNRSGIRFADLLNRKVFAEKLKSNLAERNLLKDFKLIYAQYTKYARKIARFRADVPLVLNEAARRGKRILFEGAQGTLLDIDHGTYPYVTSSNASAGGACTGTGIGPTKIDKVIGVVKAYTTRVGEGPFPTEFPPVPSEEFRTRGNEYGATTGRPRRCGWFDAVIARHSILVNGIDELAVTKLDVLDGLATISLCTGYRYKNELLRRLPADIDMLSKCRPIYEKHKGWNSSTAGARRSSDLPKEARAYLGRLSELLDIKISMVSTGSRREDTVIFA